MIQYIHTTCTCPNQFLIQSEGICPNCGGEVATPVGELHDEPEAWMDASYFEELESHLLASLNAAA